VSAGDPPRVAGGPDQWSTGFPHDLRRATGPRRARPWSGGCGSATTPSRCECAALGWPDCQCGARKAGATSSDDHRLGRAGLHRDGPNQLWVTDITEHPTARGDMSGGSSTATTARKVNHLLALHRKGKPSRPTPSLGSVGDRRTTQSPKPSGPHADRTTQPASLGDQSRASQCDRRDIAGFHNRQRRHSALGWATPLEFEKQHRQAAYVSSLTST
jgi:putative transposase